MEDVCTDGYSFCFGGPARDGVECIPSNQVCDGKIDCTTGTDEATCDEAGP